MKRPRLPTRPQKIFEEHEAITSRYLYDGEVIEHEDIPPEHYYVLDIDRYEGEVLATLKRETPRENPNYEKELAEFNVKLAKYNKYLQEFHKQEALKKAAQDEKDKLARKKQYLQLKKEFGNA